MTQSFARFSIVPDGDAYRLGFTLADGATVELAASSEQLDELAEEIDRRLDIDENQRQTLRG